MARADAGKIYESLSETGLLPLFSQADAETAIGLATALANAGCTLLELTHRNENALEVFKKTEAYFAKQPNGLLLGAGSVVDAATAAAYMEAGACFIVGPGFVEEVAVACRQRMVPYIPGCLTPTELLRAEKAGSKVLKLFPASQADPGLIKALKGPCPWMHIMPTGGVKLDEASLKAWFDAGAFCVGAGSELFPADEVEAKDWAPIEARVRQALALVAKLKPKIIRWSGEWGS